MWIYLVSKDVVGAMRVCPLEGHKDLIYNVGTQGVDSMRSEHWHSQSSKSSGPDGHTIIKLLSLGGAVVNASQVNSLLEPV